MNVTESNLTFTLNIVLTHNFNFSKPLTFVNEKSQKKEAVAVFKLVQIYMSDRKAKVGNEIFLIYY